MNNDCELLNTNAFTRFIGQKQSLLTDYENLLTRYRACIHTLEGWKGEGADAFRSDASLMEQNQVALGEILGTLCATISDILDAFAEVDTHVGEANRNALNGG